MRQQDGERDRQTYRQRTACTFRSLLKAGDLEVRSLAFAQSLSLLHNNKATKTKTKIQRQRQRQRTKTKLKRQRQSYKDKFKKTKTKFKRQSRLPIGPDVRVAAGGSSSSE